MSEHQVHYAQPDLEKKNWTVYPKSSFQIQVGFAFHLEIKSGGRVETESMLSSGKFAVSVVKGLPCHLQLLVHSCVPGKFGVLIHQQSLWLPLCQRYQKLLQWPGSLGLIGQETHLTWTPYRTYGGGAPDDLKASVKSTWASITWAEPQAGWFTQKEAQANIEFIEMIRTLMIEILFLIDVILSDFLRCIIITMSGKEVLEGFTVCVMKLNQESNNQMIRKWKARDPVSSFTSQSSRC